MAPTKGRRPDSRYRQQANRVPWRELERRRMALERELFGDPPTYFEPAPSPRNERRVAELLDILLTFGVRDPEDPAQYWNRGSIFFGLGRFEEAASDFIIASHLFKAAARSPDPLTGDENDWAKTAVFHACEACIRSGFHQTAGVLLRKLRGRDRAHLEQLLQEIEPSH